MNIIMQLKFELAYLEAAILHFSHYTTRLHKKKKKKKKKKKDNIENNILTKCKMSFLILIIVMDKQY